MGILKFILPLSFVLSSFAFAQTLSTTRNVTSGKALSRDTMPEYQLFYFWATWCPDCKEKMTSDLSPYKKGNLEFVAIATDKDINKVKDYLGANKVGVPVYFDEQKELQKLFTVFSVPTAILTKKNKDKLEVIYQMSGTDWTEMKTKLAEIH